MKAVISLAHQLGLTVTAEGIETAEQCELMRRLGCGFAQGYWFGRPEPAETAGRLIEQNPEWFTGHPASTLQVPMPAPGVVTGK